MLYDTKNTQTFTCLTGATLNSVDFYLYDKWATRYPILLCMPNTGLVLNCNVTCQVSIQLKYIVHIYFFSENIRTS